MKPLIYKIDVTCSLEFSAREVELLECLTSYENKHIAKALFGEESSGHTISYNGGVTRSQMEDFLDTLRKAAVTMKGYVNESAKKGLIR